MPHFQPSPGLFTDLYQLTMAQAYWQSGTTTVPATFSLFFRKYPAGRAYFVFAGLADVLEYLANFRLTPTDIDFLRSLGRFRADFLDYLESVRFSGNVRAMSEGTVFFANEPVMEVTAPIIEAQLVETYALNQIHLQSVLATKASRVRYAAGGKQVVDFGARRAHGTDAANKLARVSYLAGFDGTSNIMAAALYKIPLYGTMAHSFITCFESETEAFRRYAEAFPDSSTFLVDTYDSIEGVKQAITVAREMMQRGHHLRGIRLDSGDLVELSQQARALLDREGFPNVEIFASGGLDEFGVAALARAGAPIDGFGVGTNVGASADAPTADCVYKLVAYGGRPVLKLSAQKQTLPGPKQVFRYLDGQGRFRHDVIGSADETFTEAGVPLLRDAMRDGRLLESAPSLETLRDRFRMCYAGLPDRHKALSAPEFYDVQVSPRLNSLRQRIVAETRQREILPAGREHPGV
jgi:nicotinate phosphoribosyltransferase